MHRIFPYVLMIILVIAMFGCSGSSEPISPANEIKPAQITNSHQLWGMWQFVADPVRGTLEIIPLRQAELHLNALPFLEPPPNVYLTLESLEFNGNIIEADIGLRHPFLGLLEFSGFDVCGILITNGSVTGFDDPDLRMAGDGDTRLLNPDGWSRWWNPSEFPVNEGTVFSYNDGLLGSPDSFADYNCTLNGYKFFCDDLSDPDTPLSDVDISSRCMFSAGQKNVRHYTIEIGSGGLIFNYAIDANWEFPQGDPPWMVPDDFGPNANRVEAWNISITELENTLWNDGSENGGDLSLLVDVWDHFDADLNTVKIESSGNFDVTSSSTAVGGGEGYSTYQIDIEEATPAPDSIELFITIESEDIGYGDLLPGKNVSVYFFHSVPVDDETPQGPVECEIGNYASATNTPFLDHPANQVKYELAWLQTGPYAGEMLVQSSTATLRRYDMDIITPPTGQHFLTLPGGTWYGIGLMYHIEVEPITGRVITVPNGLGDNNSMLIFDNQGNLLSPTSGLSVGGGRKIMAMHSNNNGDLWLLTCTPYTWTDAHLTKLERWVYQGTSPYYVHDPSSDLDTDSFLEAPDPFYGASVPNNVVDLVISRSAQRIYIFQQAEVGEHNGWLNVFDINDSGPPTHRADLSTKSLFSLPTWRGFNANQKNAYGGIWVDHTEEIYDQCRILVYGRSHPSQYTMLLKLDADMNVLNETTQIPGVSSPYTMGINVDTDIDLRNIVFVNYPPSQCYMGAPPAGW